MSWPDRLLRACFAVFVAATALYAAVRLVSAVWMELLGGALAIAIVTTTVWLLIQQRQRW